MRCLGFKHVTKRLYDLFPQHAGHISRNWILMSNGTSVYVKDSVNKLLSSAGHQLKQKLCQSQTLNFHGVGRLFIHCSFSATNRECIWMLNCSALNVVFLNINFYERNWQKENMGRFWSHFVSHTQFNTQTRAHMWHGFFSCPEQLSHIGIQSNLIGQAVHPSTLCPKIPYKYLIINMQ